MAVFRIPILVWENFNGTFSAQAIGSDYFFPPTAFAEQKTAAISEVKEYLQWLYENEWWREAEEFENVGLTDRFGRVTNFTSTVVIMTSNLGAERFARGDIGFSESENVSNEKEIKAFFRPEFFNRLDAVVQFKPLDKVSLYKITEKEISAITKREGLAEKGIKLLWTQEVIEHLSKKGFDARFGARPLQRTIETLLTAPLAEFLLQNPKLKDCEILVNLENEYFVFAVKF